MDVLNLDVASEFLLIAATLVELKSRRLLPTGDDLDLDDELALWEERDLLLHRLVECKTFKEAAVALSVLAAEADRSVGRTLGVDERYLGLMPDLLEGVGADDLRRAYLRAIAPKPVPRIDLDHVAPIRASVTDAMAELVDELPRVGRITFRALTGDLVERLEVVVRFLAVLELFKVGLVDLDQARTFGDIVIGGWGGRRRGRPARRRRRLRRMTGTPPPLPPDELGDDVRDEARRAIEAIVLVGEQPVDTRLLAQLLELRPAIVEELCRELAAEYEAEGRGFQLARVAGGWRFQTHPDQAPYVERFVLEGQTAKLSAAALETLAIVAYKQPISRAQVGAIRGVSVDGVMRTLQQRGYIAEVGRDPGPARPSCSAPRRPSWRSWAWTRIDDLPALGDFVPGADVVEQLERGGPTARTERRTPAGRDRLVAAGGDEAVADAEGGDGRRPAEPTSADGDGGPARPGGGHPTTAGDG